MISEEKDLQCEWSVLPLLENKRAFCLGYLIETNWTVLSLIIDKKHTEWMIQYTKHLINDFKQFFEGLVEKADLGKALKTKLRNFHSHYKKLALQYPEQ